MTSHRLIAGLALALLLLTSTGYAASQTVLSADPGDDAPQTSYVAAPTPRALSGDVPAGSPLGPSRVAPRWVAGVAERTGIPRPALRAYARAQLDAPSGCAVGWTTLAGIGRVESFHGTIGGRRLGPGGRSSSPILGVALDGAGDVAAVPATAESQRWHGDPRWEHALGPMQFLWSTWSTWGTDGDGDGAADPHDVDDAAAAAAAYLCAGGRDLATGEDWTTAVLAYNRSGEYVDAVHDAATGYATAAR